MITSTKIKVSVLFNEPKLLKYQRPTAGTRCETVSVLFNEPKLLKCGAVESYPVLRRRFSALQRAEIAEILLIPSQQRRATVVSVLFNEPKLLKFLKRQSVWLFGVRFSALQRAEIAEIRISHPPEAR